MKLTRRNLVNLFGSALALSSLSSRVLAKSYPEVLIETSMGDITLRLRPDRAPITVENFLRYVDENAYEGTIFHRVIAGFMIQGGGFDQRFSRKNTFDPIVLESRGGLPNVTYSVAMARTSDPHSATNQFFINVADNDFLNDGNTPDGHGYAVFAEVVSGFKVVEAISIVPTSTNAIGHRDVPVKSVVIHRITRL